jgi:hypothetical protein
MIMVSTRIFSGSPFSALLQPIDYFAILNAHSSESRASRVVGQNDCGRGKRPIRPRRRSARHLAAGACGRETGPISSTASELNHG